MHWHVPFWIFHNLTEFWLRVLAFGEVEHEKRRDKMMRDQGRLRRWDEHNRDKKGDGERWTIEQYRK